jgi:HSP20 family protein
MSILKYEIDPEFHYWPGMKDELPVVDIMHDHQSYMIKAYVPGMDIEDLCVEIIGNVLIIKSCDRDIPPHDGKSYLHREMFTGKFKRKISLPDDARQEEIITGMQRGILTVIIPKKCAA